MLDTLWQDVRYAARSLRRRPLVTAVAVLSLALGVGVNTAMFSVFDRVLLARLSVPSPDALVKVSSPGPRSGNVSTNDSMNPEESTPAQSSSGKESERRRARTPGGDAGGRGKPRPSKGARPPPNPGRGLSGPAGGPLGNLGFPLLKRQHS